MSNTTTADCVAAKILPPVLLSIFDSSTMSCNKVQVVQMRNLYHTNAVHTTEETSCWIFWALTTMPRNTCGDRAFLSQTFFYGGCTIAPFVQMLNLLKGGWEYTFSKIQTILKIHHQVTMLLIFTFSGVKISPKRGMSPSSIFLYSWIFTFAHTTWYSFARAWIPIVSSGPIPLLK